MSGPTNYLRAVRDAEPQFLKVASKRKLVMWEEECEFALQAVKRNQMLQECDLSTIQDAVKNVAAVGLSLNPAHGYAYLVPDSIKVGNAWVKVCQLRVSFKGLIKLANDAGVAKWVRADVVKANDEFTFNGAWEKPTHQMNPFGDRGESVGVYCTIKTHDGEYLTEVAPWSEVMKAKAAAKTQNVWDNWPDEMAKKFIIKRASKQWPASGEGYQHLSEAIDVINEYEGSESLEAPRTGVMAAVMEDVKFDEGQRDRIVNDIDSCFTVEEHGLECVDPEGLSTLLQEANESQDLRLAVWHELPSKIRTYLKAEKVA